MKQTKLLMAAAFGTVVVVMSPALRAEDAAPAPAQEAKQDEAKADEAKADETTPATPVAQAEEQTAPPAPAPETAKVEEIKAQPVEQQGFTSVESSASGVSTAATTTGEEKKKGFTARVILDHSVGSGTFMSNDTLQGTNRYVDQAWDIRPAYTFDFKGHTLKAGARILFDTELTTPNNSTGRRFTMADGGLSLADAELYNEAFTGIVVGASVGWLLPFSRESWNTYNRVGGASAGITLDRSIGPFDINYGITARKFFNTSEVAEKRSDSRSIRESDTIRSGKDGTVFVAAGNANTSFDLRNTIGVTFNATEQLSIGYSVVFWQNWHYVFEQNKERNQYTAQNADVGRQRGADMLWPSLSVDYDATNLVKMAGDVPMTLALSLGISALHPAQDADNKGIKWPFFYDSMADNQAANNYGSVFFDIDGTY